MAAQRPKPWPGIRTRRVMAAGEPDATPRLIEIPAGWDDEAAGAIAALGASGLRAAAEVWLHRLPQALALSARSWLLARRAAPEAGIWAGDPDGFTINLAAFDEPGLGLDAAALRQVATQAVAALSVLAPGVPPVLRLTDLDGMLAGSGVDYDSAAGRDLAASVCAMLSQCGAGLVAGPGAVDPLLGVEAGGIAPRFGWLDPAGRLSRAATALLAARGQSAEAALAGAVGGRPVLRLAGAAAHRAMRAAVAKYVTLPEMAEPEAASARRDLPERPGGYAQRVTLGGHKVFVRTAEYADGALAEVSLALPREAASVRAMADSLGQLASLALQHGTPLAEIIDLLAGTRFGPAGVVDGDPDVPRALSPLDYLARSLAHAYLPGAALPPAEDDMPAPELPLELPVQARPRLRVVG